MAHPLLPQRRSTAYENIQKRLFDHEDPMRGRFTAVANLEELLIAAQRIRGNLDGNDRDEIVRRAVAQGISERHMQHELGWDRTARRYILVDAPKPLGVITKAPLADIPTSESIVFKAHRDGTAHAYVPLNPGAKLPKTKTATLQFGNSKGHDVLDTVYLGLPTPLTGAMFDHEGVLAGSVRYVRNHPELSQEVLFAEYADYDYFLALLGQATSLRGFLEPDKDAEIKAL